MTATRYFTLEQANRALPLVRRIVQDIRDAHARWRDLVHRYELVAAQARPEWGESPEQLSLRAEVDGVAHEINDFLQELEAIGCVFKGFEEGLVDFLGKLDEQDIYWCWKMGEERIEHWHTLTGGYAGRQRVPEVVRG